MISRLLLYGMMLVCAFAQAQKTNNDSAAQRVSWLPQFDNQSAAAIAMSIQSRYNSKREQLYAAYSWVTTNIKYDDDSSYYFNWSVDQDAKIAATIRRKKGVCENFASLFSDLATRIGIPSYVVHGYPSIDGGRRNVAHSWSAVNLDDEWFLCDPTWDAGFRDNFQYFLVSPYTFVHTHIPFDPMWQLLENPIGYKMNSAKSNTIFYYKDSIKTFLASDSLQQYLAIERRMKHTDTNKELLEIWKSYNRMNIIIIGEEQNMQLYNSAVADINDAADLFNTFVEYRNNRFLPAKPDAAVRQLLVPVSALIAGANKKLDMIGTIAKNFQYDTESLRKRLTSLSQRSEEQLSFLKKYLAAGTPEKEQMLYIK